MTKKEMPPADRQKSSVCRHNSLTTQSTVIREFTLYGQPAPVILGRQWLSRLIGSCWDCSNQHLLLYKRPTRRRLSPPSSERYTSYMSAELDLD